VENNILDFKKRLLINEEIECKNNTSIKLGPLKSTRLQENISYTFHLCSKFHSEYIFGESFRDLITLDKEDIEYFKRKYLPKLEEELNNKLENIKKEYGK